MRDNIHLVLFLTRAMPLRRWDDMGILNREIAIYKQLHARLGQVSIVTSGGEEERAYQSRLGDINILYNRWRLSPNLYSLLAPILHAKVLRRADVYKNNQPDGAWTAVLAAKLFRKPLITRAGYLWAELHRTDGGRGAKAALIDWLQGVSFKNADQIILTTATMKQYVVENYAVPPQKITVVPNYVDTSQFHPRPEIQPWPGRICFVGRLHPVKNLDLLIQAVAQIPGASLIIIGDGPQRESLVAEAAQLNAPVQFLGIVPQEQIALELNRSELFVLPSRAEGHPKALIEAMAAGTAVIGTRVPGIQEFIEHGQTGWLCLPDSDSIRDAIQHLLARPELQAQLGKAGCAYASKNFALAHIVAKEYKLVSRLVQ
jgi:glycosyltransferase involved in cell wall biosynthesis